jgi:hypothetical protein
MLTDQLMICTYVTLYNGVADKEGRRKFLATSEKKTIYNLP